MENPQTWGKAEHVVAEVMGQVQDDRARGVVGLSAVRRITDALRAEGLLKEEEEG